MTSKTLFGKLALAGCSLIAATQIGRAQPTFTDTGTTAPPTPGALDVYQLLSGPANGDTAGAGGALNYYDNNSGTAAPGSSGSTFQTGSSSPGGYVLNSLTVKMGGYSSGGNDLNGSSQTWSVTIFKLDNGTGTALTNAVRVYNAVTAASTVHVVSNWWTFANLNVPMLANTNYAYTIVNTTSRSSSYDDMGYTTNVIYLANGQQVCRILTAGGLVTYYPTYYIGGTNISAAFDLGITLPTGLTVGTPTVSVANPVNLGTSVTLTAGTAVDNVGNGNYFYQWLTDGGGGGALTNIPGATGSTYIFNTATIAQTNLGNYVFSLKVTDSTSQSVTTPSLTVDVFLRQGAASFGNILPPTNPTPGPSDIVQFENSGLGTGTNGIGSHNQGNLNYYTDNGPSSGVWMGNTFTTGGNAEGYTLASLAVLMDGQPGPGGPYYGYGAFATNLTYAFYLYKVSADGTTCQTIGEVTNWGGAGLYCQQLSGLVRIEFFHAGNFTSQ